MTHQFCPLKLIFNKGIKKEKISCPIYFSRVLHPLVLGQYGQEGWQRRHSWPWHQGSGQYGRKLWGNDGEAALASPAMSRTSTVPGPDSDNVVTAGLGLVLGLGSELALSDSNSLLGQPNGRLVHGHRPHTSTPNTPVLSAPHTSPAASFCSAPQPSPRSSPALTHISSWSIPCSAPCSASPLQCLGATSPPPALQFQQNNWAKPGVAKPGNPTLTALPSTGS